MASTFAVAPGSLNGRDSEPRRLSPPAFAHQRLSLSPDDSNLVCSQFASPSGDLSDTPAGSSTNLSHYQPSDLGDFDGDPFFGADFANLQADTPSFLDDQSALDQPALLTSAPHRRHEIGDGTSYPLTPTHTASVHTTTPRSEARDPGPMPTPDPPMLWVSPEQLQKSFEPTRITIEASNLTPSHTSSNRTSEDGLAPAPVVMDPPSPRVTVSVWDKDYGSRAPPVERSFDDNSNATRGDIRSAGDLISSAHGPDFIPGTRVSRGRWQADPATQRRGLDPERRPAGETPSIKEVMAQRSARERNQEVDKWLAERLDAALAYHATDFQALEQSTSDHDDGIPLGDQTENKYLAGQTYYNEQGSGQMSQVDRDIIAADHKWADAPVLPHITRGVSDPCQPQSSQAAIDKFERMCRDNDSIISRSATWGTRRRSHPSVLDLAVETSTSGGFLKKLSMSRGSGDKSSKSGSLLRDLRGLVRRPSVSSLRKRSRSRSRSGRDDEAAAQPGGEQQVKRESTPHLSPTSGTPSWAKKSTPSINTALASMAHNFVSMGSSRSRSGSISGTTPAASPKNSLTSSLSVRNTLRRPRSKSEIPKTSVTPANPTESHPNLVGMWKRSGGPPVATLGKSSDAHADDDDDDDDEELYDENDVKANPNIIDDIPTNFAGFQQHVLTLNPGLDKTHGYLVDRIAQQQVVRFKLLLSAKVKHLGLGAACPCGTPCAALGDSANALDQRGDAWGMEPFPTQLNDGDDAASNEGVITQESFPQDIPMPPTQRLPAEFECQLCFQRKRFQKPSDWTKHVHEDVQPFTCTWDKCRDPKFFKRKADWVRHENEGHRHLEWWTCDVDDCRHTCYRRDNFLQHLVREHKFLEPKVKTKAAMKRAGGTDPTWHKVEQCHIETSTRPQEEPCRFCGKVFPTWKKLTVHLAKHMEQISLPVLRLVAARAKELDADTIPDDSGHGIPGHVGAAGPIPGRGP
ncbi:C2H2 finger domain-containing protein [Hirsutella rhossiliensis]|uniref:C2H2 finger domain-containing protein n=1 Tax=Hirsutella rhossiliensis TaxID=111463 RepID=A0A9P8N5C5_9HYPO|nr:C2H2 finger domain-containing protein [Hirsutella rhossiliensis]KAH0967150.1 C2H2 finger domain-containing protein [Hirsutella rhossiliensis]